MNNQLYSISKIFTEKLFRIPDYQRGYAWGEKQLKDFWSDIIQLEKDHNHYVGVLTLELVPTEIWEKWEDDRWIIESKSFEPLYVVDGQQRLTTTIILIQAIIETIKYNQRLNYTSQQKIKEKFIYESKGNGISRSYIFGYEKDNPSYDFLKKRIFLENGGGYRDEETIYTQNLEKAKQFFVDNLDKLDKEQIEIIYKKVTQHLLFNIYTISSDIDVFVAFETMNNRGKPLSNLELLKNRLIYLSTKFDSDISEKNQLRKRINNSWKAVYHYLGKNKSRPLYDDGFLLNHFIITFGKNISNTINRYRSYSEIYEDFLLNKKFTLKSIKAEQEMLTIGDINNYIISLQESVKTWYSIFNPTQSLNFDDDEKLYLDKLYRLNPGRYGSLLLTIYLQKPPKQIKNKLLKLLERYEFLSSMSYRYSYDFDFKEMSVDLSTEKSNKFEVAIKTLEQAIYKLHTKDFIESLVDRFKSGFYKWSEIKYFLYEYELSLKDKSKTKRDKINWDIYYKEQYDFVTVEHIYPQKPDDLSWKSVFNFHHKQNEKLCNSLGNLLPLSKPKNSSLQNTPFLNKIDNGKNKVGYRYGSYSENEISKFEDWTPQHILNRGLDLLKFLETRWEIQLGDTSKKIDILGLSFLVNNKTQFDLE